MAVKKKGRKMDKKLVASKQKFEIRYVSARFKIPVKIVREVVNRVGISRTKIYVELRLMGYIIPVKTKKKTNPLSL